MNDKSVELYTDLVLARLREPHPETERMIQGVRQKEQKRETRILIVVLALWTYMFGRGLFYSLTGL